MSDQDKDDALRLVREVAKGLMMVALVIKKGLDAMGFELEEKTPPKQIGGKRDDTKPRG